MNYHDAFGVPGVVTRMFNNYGPRQNPRYVTGTIITQALDARDDRARPARSDARLLLLHRRRARPPDGRRTRHAGRPLRLRPGQEHLDARLGRAHPPRRPRAGALGRRARSSRPPSRYRPGRERGDGAARRLREAQSRDRLGAARLVGGRCRAHDRVVRREPRRAGSAGSTGSTQTPGSRREDPRHGRRRLPRLAPRRAARGRRPRRLRRAPRRLRPDEVGRRRATLRDAEPERVFHLAARGRRHRREPRESRAASGTRT